MINKTFIKKIRASYLRFNKERNKIIIASNEILHNSKRVIFVLHRDDFKKASSELKSIEIKIKKLDQQYQHARLLKEGSYNAAIEEFVEAYLFNQVLNQNEIKNINDLKIETASYLGGLCDLTGELVRKAINNASNNDFTTVKEYSNLINNIMAQLIEFDMTGYLRNKYDQAKNNLKKIEQIHYEIQLRTNIK